MLFEGIALSSLDGAACELQVSREELTLALADEEATQEFAEAHGIERRGGRGCRSGPASSAPSTTRPPPAEIDGLEETSSARSPSEPPSGPAIDGLQALSGDDSIQGLLRAAESRSTCARDLPSLGDLPSDRRARGPAPLNDEDEPPQYG